MKRCESGFTLLEVLVVILIISILATTVGLALRHLPGRARVAQAKNQVSIFKSALENYYFDAGNYPSQEQGLHALCEKPLTPPLPKDYPDSGYLDGSNVPLDPWGHPYVYTVPAKNGKPYEIMSYGKDGEPGGTGEDADISSLDL